MTKKYFTKFKTSLLFGYFIYSSTIICLASYDLFCGAPIKKVLFVFSLSLITGFIVVPFIMLILTRLLPVYVKKEGLRSWNIFSFYKTIPWNDIQSIKTFNFIGFKYILVKSKLGGLSIWIPTGLNDVDSFLNSIEHCGGDRNLFQEYFNK